jgi:hypothetical protein
MKATRAPPLARGARCPSHFRDAPFPLILVVSQTPSPFSADLSTPAGSAFGLLRSAPRMTGERGEAQLYAFLDRGTRSSEPRWTWNAFSGRTAPP